MKIITSIKDQIDYCNSLIKEGENIALIPTMGNLHKGHESLILEPSLIKNKKIVSLFVNPFSLIIQMIIKVIRNLLILILQY